MNKLTSILSVSIALAVLQLATHSAVAEAEANVRTMLQAARSLEFDSPVSAQANKAYMLEKQGTIRSQVAVIFGYADNASACEQIAQILTEARLLRISVPSNLLGLKAAEGRRSPR